MKINKNFLVECIQACINSYEGKHGKVVPMFDKWNKRDIFNVEFYFAEKDGVGWIIFRGTDEWKDWLQNFDANGYDVVEGQIHQGTKEDNDKAQPNCEHFIENYETIVIVGHSKGANQTGVLYYHLKKKFPDKKFIPVMVAPAKISSNHKQMREVFKDVITIINGEDFVTKQPFWKWSHKGKIIRIGKQNVFWKIPVIRLLGTVIHVGEKVEFKPRKDHYPQEYMKNMLAYKKSICFES